MKGFKQCQKGHFYKDNLENCPYCPSDTAKTQKTEVLRTEAGDKTQKLDNTEIDAQKTQVFGGTTNNESISSGNNNVSSDTSFDPTKTMIHGVDSDDSSDLVQVSRRKLRGWLVSFDIEKFGIDFRVLEGRNTMGSKSNNDITIQDAEVSSLHALILCKKDKFIITDELSSNGTLVNGKELSPRDPYDLNDGDEIKIGKTTLLFKTAFKR
tara:strand:+ start:3177 stop:3806 length:630 start_codon:yes stop_codon:yes gene_type:complete